MSLSHDHPWGTPTAGMANDHGAGNTPIRLISDTSLWPTNYVQHHGDGYPIIARHAREGGHPGSSTGFPLKACGNDDLGYWALYSVALC
jgi:hypothetical protein